MDPSQVGKQMGNLPWDVPSEQETYKLWVAEVPRGGKFIPLGESFWTYCGSLDSLNGFDMHLQRLATTGTTTTPLRLDRTRLPLALAPMLEGLREAPNVLLRAAAWFGVYTEAGELSGVVFACRDKHPAPEGGA